MSKKVKKIYRWLRKRQLPKNIQWMFDFDYINSLSEEEKEWLNKFIKEYLDAAIKKGDEEAIHNTDNLRKDCYNRRNRQNRDLMSILNCNGKMWRINHESDEGKEDEENPEN